MITALVYLLIFTTGLFKSQIDFHTTPEKSISYFPVTPDDYEVVLYGTVKDIPVIDSSKLKFFLASDSISNFISTYETDGDVLVTVRDSKNDVSNIKRPDIKPGDKVKLTGKLFQAMTKRNPGEFDYRQYLELHNIHRIFVSNRFDDVGILSRDNSGYLFSNIVFPIQVFAINNIKQLNPGQGGAFLNGLVTGTRGDISAETKDDFLKAGVMHLIAVSGLNVAYLILIVTLTLSIFRIPTLPKTILIIIIIIFYCVFTGSTPSIVRASIMGILFLLSKLIERKTNSYHIIGLSALIILLYDSKQLFDAGFILSYVSVLSLVFFYGLFEERLSDILLSGKSKIKRGIYLIISALIITIGAQIGTLPFTAMYFEKVSIISVFANLISVPLANLSLAIGFFQIITAPFSMTIASLIAMTNNLLLNLQLQFISFCASFDFSYVNIHFFNTLNTIIYFIVLILLFSHVAGKIKNRIALSILLISFAIVMNQDYNNKLRLTVLDVGEGSCSFVETPGNRSILVDCRFKNLSYNVMERNIIPFIRRSGYDHLDLVILTDVKRDNLKGLSSLLKDINVGRIITPMSLKNFSSDNIIASKQIIVQEIKKGDIINIGNDLRIYTLYPDSGTDSNLVLKLVYGENEFLFTGNIRQNDEEKILSDYNDFLKSDVMLIPRYGSNSSSSTYFLLKALPSYSIISSGRNRVLNHPSPIVINRLKNLDSEILQTSDRGAIILEADRNEIKQISWR